MVYSVDNLYVVYRIFYHDPLEDQFYQFYRE